MLRRSDDRLTTDSGSVASSAVTCQDWRVTRMIRPDTTLTISRTIAGLLVGDERFSSITLAILYGSVAHGTHRSSSDVDLAVCAQPRTPIADDLLVTLSLTCEGLVGRTVQVRDLARAHGVFLKEVMTTGQVIHQTDARTRGELIIRMLAFVEDWLPMVRRIQAAKRERFLAGP